MDASTPALADSDVVAEQVAPPVVAVVVTCDPGWWLEECLRALAAQDYPALSVLVVDADSTEDPTARVAAVMPNAFVRRVRRRRGFGTAANEVLNVVEGASHFLFCHDDVAPGPASVRLLVEEAFRSNAGVVAPKLVSWFHPDRLLAVGMGMDGFGAPVGLVERGDLDQEQHDAVRDVFYAPSPCTLVRADLFSILGGYDTNCGVVGEDLDLGWRAHLAGARVVSAPGAAVRHLEATDLGRRAVDGRLRVADADTEADRAAAAASTARHVVPADDPPDEAWDALWDEPDTTTESGQIAQHARHHASRRARREAERQEYSDHWLADDTEWDDDAWDGRVRRRRPAGRGFTPPPVEEPHGPDHEVLEDMREIARLRAVITNYGTARLMIRLPFLLALTLVGAAVGAWRDGADRARRLLHPWTVMLMQSGSLRRRRRAVRKGRSVGDRDIVDMQVHGAARFSAAFREAMVPVVDASPRPSRRPAVIAWVVVLAVLGFGSRHILGGHIPLVGQFAPWPSLSRLTASAGSGWRPTGLGTAGPAPTLFGLLAVGGTVLLGHTTLLQHVLILGMVPLGALGVYRISAPLSSRRAQIVALVAYLIVPLPYNAIARGEWGGLVAYAAAPWVLGILLRVAALTPFDVPPAAAGRVARPPLTVARRVVAIGLVGALAAAVQPGFLVSVVVMGIGVALGAALTSRRAAGLRALVVAAGGAVAAVPLLFPWVLSWLPPTGEWAIVTGGQTSRPGIGVAALLRFQTGPLGAGPLGYALLVAAALPLIVGRSWRADWAVRMWAVAAVALLAAWAGQHGALGAVWPPADVLLAPAAVALAVAIALGMASFDTDLAGFTFGWRQVVAGVAATATFLACLPILGEVADGRWQQRTAGYDAQFSWMGAKRADGDFRVLWVGAPDVLPVAGWRLTDGVAYATTRNGTPVLTDDWPGTSHGATRLMAQALQLIRRGDTAQIGHVLAPMGIRYLVAVRSPAPLDGNLRDLRSLPADLSTGLASQLDLFPIDTSPQAMVFENAAWFPMRTVLPDAAAQAAALNDPRVARSVQIDRPPPVLTHQSSPTSFSGPVPAGPVEVAEAPSGHWHLRVGGHDAGRQAAFGSANLFHVTGAGPAHLGYRTPLGWRLADVVGVALWLGALAVVVEGRRRRRVTP